MSKKSNRTNSAESLKDTAIKRVAGGESISKVAKALNLNKGSLSRWVGKSKQIRHVAKPLQVEKATPKINEDKIIIPDTVDEAQLVQQMNRATFAVLERVKNGNHNESDTDIIKALIQLQGKK